MPKGHRIPYAKLIIKSFEPKTHHKQFVKVVCAVCGIEGMAYCTSDIIAKPHYCYKHLEGKK